MTETVISPTDNIETTYLSFSNPNYHLEDRLNSNISKSLLSNGNGTTTDANEIGIKNMSLSFDETTKNCKNYANIDPSKMGITPSPSSPDRNLVLQKLNSPTDDEESSDESTYDSGPEGGVEHNLLVGKDDDKDSDEVTYYADIDTKPRGFLGYYSLLEAKAREYQCSSLDSPDSPDDDMELTDGGTTPLTEQPASEKFENETDIYSPDSNDSGIQSDARSDDGVSHAHGRVNDDVYAVINKTNKTHPSSEDTKKETFNSNTPESSSDTSALPPGWQKHEDDDGPYYWHIKSGTIQREPPLPGQAEALTTHRSTSQTSETSTSSVPSSPTSVTSNTEEHLQEFEGHALQYAAKSLQSLCSQPEKKIPLPEEISDDKPIRFAVRSLGWVKIAEEDLTPERSSKAVNKCIVDLSLGRNDINDVVGRWGDGKDLFMDLDTKSLRLIDTQDGTFLNCQPIHSIRVWGVGRDNGRDFAYVARDKTTRQHMCHVFRCDTPARQIANTLRDICKKIMAERNFRPSTMQRLTRPTDLPNLDKTNQCNGQKLSFQSLYSNASFPTPMEEPKKIIRAHYLGTQEVPKATGMDVLNEAVERACMKVPPEKWTFVNIAVAPSTITITEQKNPDNKLDECRVRYLSFMGISIKNVKLCSFIMHTAQDRFIAYIFHCEPSAGSLCKTIEAACKLRYQKCLDAHPQTPKSPQQQGKGIGAALKAGVKASVQNVIGLLKSKRGQC